MSEPAARVPPPIEAEPPTPSGTVAGRATLLGPALVMLLYFPTLFGTFLSDDYLVNTMLTHGAVPRVLWSEVLADFGRGWAGLTDSGMYRPMVSLSFGVTYSLFGSSPFWFHLLNVLVHALAALFGAIVCQRCSPQRPVFSALLGGAVLALHPAVAEATCWVSARTTGLQWMFAMLAMAGFASYLRSGQRRALSACIAGFLGALMSKENAVTLPVSFLVLDVLIRGWRIQSRRIRLHAGMFGIVLGYFLLRRVVLGSFLGGGGEGVQTIQSDDIFGTLLAKLQLLVYPVGGSLGAPMGAVVGGAGLLGLGLLLVPSLLAPRTFLLLPLILLWLLAQLAPTYQMPVGTATLVGSRMVVGAGAALAIGLSWAGARAPWPRLAVIGAWLLGASLLVLGVGRMTAFLRAYDDMRQLQKSLAAAAKTARPETPLGVLTVNRDRDGITFLNCNALFPLLERPYARDDRPLVSFGYVFQPVPDSEHLMFDVGPWRAMREMGASMFEWHGIPGGQPLVVIDHPADRTPVTLPALRRVDPAADNTVRFLAPTPVDPRGVEALEIEVAGDCRGGRVGWLYFNGDQPQAVAPFGRAVAHSILGDKTRRGATDVYYVDLSHLLTFLAIYKERGLAGFQVTLEGQDCRPLAVRMLPRVEPLPLPARIGGATVSLAATQHALIAPNKPAGANTLTLYLVGPDTTHSTLVEAGPVRLDAEMQALVAVILRCSRQKLYYFYFEANGTKTWRSEVDWLVFERGQ